MKAELARGRGVVAAALLQRVRDQVDLGLLDRFAEGRRRRLPAGPARCEPAGHHVRKIVEDDRFLEAEDDGVLDGVLELADIARPVVRRERLQHVRREA